MRYQEIDYTPKRRVIERAPKQLQVCYAPREKVSYRDWAAHWAEYVNYLINRYTTLYRSR